MAVVEIHLVALAVAERGCGARSLTERSVEGGGIFDGVGHNRRRGVTGCIKCLPDCAHAAVHHIGGSHHIRACLYMGESSHGQQFQGLVIVDITSAQHTAVTMGGVFAHAHIRDQIEVGEIFLSPAQSALDNAFRVIGLGADLILDGGNSEKHDFIYTCI